MKNQQEQWKTLPQNPQYSVSNLGVVKGAKGVLKGTKTKNGNVFVVIYSEGKKQAIYVQRLVAEAFIPCANAADMLPVHIDKNKENNAASNLEWVSKAEFRTTYKAGRKKK